MREIDAIAQLGSALVLCPDTDDADLVAHGETERADETLTGIAGSTPAGIAAIDVEAFATIRQVDVTILVVGNLINGTANQIVDIGSHGLSQELSN